MTVNELGAEKRATILSIAAKHSVTSVRVFGSFAREKGAQIAISICSLRRAANSAVVSWGPLFDLEAEVGRRVDVVEESSLNPLIRDRVLREAIPL
jgi:uncharacterized protein